MKYCLGYTHYKCDKCQNNRTWLALNQMPDALRLSIQNTYEPVNIDKCRLTKMSEFNEIKDTK